MKQISMVSNGQAKQPRHLAFANGKVFISCFDGYVDVMDTNTFEITKRIKVGANPDHIFASNGQVYVSNSGGLNFPELDSTISIISSENLIETAKLVVGKNPGKIIETANGEILNIVRGDYNSIPGTVALIQNNEIQEFLPYEWGNMTRMNNELVVSYVENNETLIRKFDMATKTISASNFINTSNIETLYNIEYEEGIDQLVLYDANGYTNSGKVLIYSIQGQLVSSYTLFQNPSSHVWIP